MPKPINRYSSALSRRQRSALIDAACRANRYSVAPYSRFQVGAALLTRSRQVIFGANVESASYGLTCCAERVALFNALTHGHRDFVAIAIVAAAKDGPMPCGACRQLLAEYAPHARLLVADIRSPGAVKEYAIRDLLPKAFLEVPTRIARETAGRPRGQTRPRRPSVPGSSAGALKLSKLQENIS